VETFRAFFYTPKILGTRWGLEKKMVPSVFGGSGHGIKGMKDGAFTTVLSSPTKPTVSNIGGSQSWHHIAGQFHPLLTCHE
jgi:hypothetical protein